MLLDPSVVDKKSRKTKIRKKHRKSMGHLGGVVKTFFSWFRFFFCRGKFFRVLVPLCELDLVFVGVFGVFFHAHPG